MHIVIKAASNQKSALASFFLNTDTTISWVNDTDNIPVADAYFDDSFEIEDLAFTMIKEKPIFVNAVVKYGQSIPAHCIRYNGWPGFLQDAAIEIACSNADSLTKAIDCLKFLKKKPLVAPDQPGMVSARVVSMIINEAYFGLGDGISTKTDIDTAMKLGTNYPFGPFEWSEKIGLKNIYSLLDKLYESSPRYAIAPAMIDEIQQLT